MIAFTRLGKMGRLGNQMFQYTFVRGMARHLGVKFYCPNWTGDEIFSLHDQEERAAELSGIKTVFGQESLGTLSFNRDALNIKDNTDIVGYFITEKYFFDRRAIREWFRFREELLAPIREKFQWIDFRNSCALHLRFGDMLYVPWVHCPLCGYYKRALAAVHYKHHVLVFSDNIKKAKLFLKNISSDLIFIEGNKNYEDLYLISLCHDCITSPSTFSWWGAWLNAYPDKTVICPREKFTFGTPDQNLDLWPEEWVKIWSGRIIWHHYYVKLLGNIWTRLQRKIRSRRNIS